MSTRSYRTADSPYEQLTNPVLEVGLVARITFPEPPSFNTMIDLAKDRTRKGPGGTWMKHEHSAYWVAQQDYKLRTQLDLDAAGWKAPKTPWQRITIVKAHFRLHNPRDPVERLAGLKWPIDLLVDLGYLPDDDDTHLVIEAIPTQEIDRARRGADLWIRRDA